MTKEIQCHICGGVGEIYDLTEDEWSECPNCAGPGTVMRSR